MEKDDLKSLVAQMYQSLLEHIDNQPNANKKQVINFLLDSIDVISHISEDTIDSIEHAKSAFENAYKEIATKSISSYKDTNKKFEQLTKLQQETLINYAQDEIDIPSITEKFSDIQTHMMEEVNKANMVIAHLTEQVKTLEKDTNIDPLTKVYNRRALSTHLDTICSKDNIGSELHFLLLDIDDFKLVNDKHGHIAGDKILIFIANILKKTLRDGDKVFRYGGEEFVILLNRIDTEHCQIITNRLLDIIRNNKLIYKGEGITVTVSIGATKYIKGDTPEEIILRADKAMYKAKESGKNKMYSEVPNGD